MRFLQKDARELVMIVLRFAAASVLLWFGVDKWVHPEAWYGYIPTFLRDMLSGEMLDVYLFLNGTAEFVLGCLLASGALLRLASAASFLYILAITLAVGSNEVAVRDVSHMGISLALFLHADAGAKRHVPQRILSTVVGAYLLLLFIFGVLYLRSVPVAG